MCTGCVKSRRQLLSPGGALVVSAVVPADLMADEAMGLLDHPSSIDLRRQALCQHVVRARSFHAA